MLRETYIGVMKKKMDEFPAAKFYIVMRFLPRYISKDSYKTGRLEKCQILSPSVKLLNDYKESDNWEEYTNRFLVEMQAPACQAEIARIAKESQDIDVFLVCIEKPPKNCHRFLLMGLMDKTGGQQCLQTK
jgi:uncharacterized protein YeaO (DUF488 family)